LAQTTWIIERLRLTKKAKFHREKHDKCQKSIKNSRRPTPFIAGQFSYLCFQMNEHLDPTSEHLSPEELDIERALRPISFDDFTGQQKVLENLKVFVEAANLRQEALDHTLLHGPPGLGKTTLAHILANELGVGLKVSSGPVLDKPGDLAGLLTNLEERDVLFIDEIHRLSPVVEEYLYSAMEDFKIDIMIESGPNARSVQIHLNPFTLVGATTRSGLLTAPMRARFGISSRLEYYNTELLSTIVERSADILKVPITHEAAIEIAGRSRGTPRICNALLRRIRDFAQIKGNGKIDLEISRYGLKALNVDTYGLDEMDNKILATIIDKFKGGPVGISTLATAVSENAETIEEVYEPFLIQQGFIMRTPRGREVTELAYRHLGRLKGGTQPGLFSDPQ
jgi:Holliday junction DNA helicase RuvB